MQIVKQTPSRALSNLHEFALLEPSSSRIHQKEPIMQQNQQEDQKKKLMKKDTLKQAIEISQLRNHYINVKNCLQKIKNATYFKSLNNLSHHEKLLINDVASNFPQVPFESEEIIVNNIVGPDLSEANSGAERFKKLILILLKEKIHQTKNKRVKMFIKFINKPLMPTSILILIWQIIIIFVILTNIFSIPLEDAFPVDFHQFECLYMRTVVNFEFVILILDVFLQFNIVIFHQGKIIQNKKEIAIVYIKKGFLMDLMAIIGFFFGRYQILITSDCNKFSNKPNFLSSLIKYIFLLKHGRMNFLLDFFKKEVCSSKKTKNYMELANLLILVITMSHYIACFWIILANYSEEYFPGQSWIIQQNSLNAPSILIYLQSMYFSIMTMTTVGYGDILPSNPIEYLACIGIMLLACGFFAYSLNTITSILVNIQNEKKLYLQEIEIIENYMRKKKINANLQQRVKNYLKCMYEAGLNDDQQEEQSVIQKLSPKLQQDLLLQDKGKIFNHIPEIHDNFSKQFILKIINKMSELRLSPDEIIQLQPDQFYFLSQGKLRYFFQANQVDQQNTYSHKHKKLYLKEFNSGDFYGAAGLFGKYTEQNLYFQSMDFSIVYTINYSQIQELINQDQDNPDSQKYFQIRDRILIYDKKLHGKCYICHSDDHDMNNCQKFFLCPCKIQVVKKYDYYLPQNRSNIERKYLKSIQYIFRYEKKLNSLYYLCDIQDRAKEIQDEQLSLIQREFEDEENVSQSDRKVNIRDIKYKKGNFQANDELEDSVIMQDPSSSQSWEIEDDNISKQEIKSSMEKQDMPTSTNINKNQQQQYQNQKSIKIPNYEYRRDKLKGVTLKPEEKKKNYQKLDSKQQLSSSHSIENESPLISQLNKDFIRNKKKQEIVKTMLSQQKSKLKTIISTGLKQLRPLNQQDLEEKNADLTKIMNLLQSFSISKNNEKEQEQQMNYELDKANEFQYYFQHNNLSQILLEYNKYREKLRRSQRLSKCKAVFIKKKFLNEIIKKN